MKLSQELASLVEKSVKEVKSSSTGDLSLPTRRMIWSKICELSKNNHTAHRILTALDTLCVKHTISKWHKVFPNDNGPDRMLEIAQQVLDGKIDIRNAMRLRDEFYADVVEKRKYKPHEYPAMFVGHAAASTVLTAIVELDESPGFFTKQDEDLDPESYEPSYLTASAYSEGFLGKGDTGKRREFWLWYLETAIPQACATAP